MDAGAVRGHLDAMILAVLDSEPAHGYGVIERLRARSGGVLELPSGTVYPALRRLERSGFIAGEWATVAGRERRTYRITGRGTRELAKQRDGWSSTSTIISAVLGL